MNTPLPRGCRRAWVVVVLATLCPAVTGVSTLQEDTLRQAVDDVLSAFTEHPPGTPSRVKLPLQRLCLELAPHSTKAGEEPGQGVGKHDDVPSLAWAMARLRELGEGVRPRHPYANLMHAVQAMVAGIVAGVGAMVPSRLRILRQHNAATTWREITLLLVQKPESWGGPVIAGGSASLGVLILTTSVDLATHERLMLQYHRLWELHTHMRENIDKILWEGYKRDEEATKLLCDELDIPRNAFPVAEKLREEKT